MIIKRFYRSLLALLCVLVTCSGFTYANPEYLSFHELSCFGDVNTKFFQQDTTKLDSLKNKPYKPSRQPSYQQKDRFGDPFSNVTSPSPLLLQDPSSLKLDVEIDTGMNYTIYEKIGDLNYRPTSSMTFEEFRRHQEKKQLKDYWKNRSAGLDGESAVSGRNLIPPIYVSPIFDRIFGGTYVEIIPRGFVTLDFGGRWQRINNPAIPIRQQRSGGFEFDQQISMNVVGKIGEKLQVTANFDNNNSFDFENNLKVEYTGFEEDILQKLEIGNVSLPLNNSLITGAQNLFGVKAQMQFGDLHVTAVASTQRGKAESITIDGGGIQGREFALQASEYDENRHFFLGHFFRDNFEKWLKGIPYITSGINVTRVEVYVVNRNNDTQTLRNIVGLMDLAEYDPDNIYRDMGANGVEPTAGASSNFNGANNLLDLISSVSREADEVNNQLEQLGFENGLDFEKITSARKLSPNEYIINSRLGYITLFRKLQNDEALVVAYEYTYNGKSYKVGELSEDYSNLEEDKVAFMKLLRPRKINITDPENNRVPTWDLMMKNIYALSGTNISREGFQLRVIYRDDKTGIDNPQLQEGATASTKPLIQILGLDKLNQSNDPQRDGNFDFVEGITIEPETGLIIFPYLEPFSDALRQEFEGDPREQALIDKYAYDELYNQTKNDAELVSNKNKYVIAGRFQAGSTSEIMIPGINIAEGSVRIYAGGSPLQEGIDYQVDYNFGRVTIINEGVLNSGKELTISYEQADLFNFQSRTLLGTRLDYRLDDDVTFGATLLHLNERPLISRISVGNEPTRNTKYGFDVNIHKESRFLTKMLDKLPLLQTKEPSSITFNAEFAQLLPGTSNVIDGEGTSYIDDFENTATPMALGNPNSWKLASTPETDNGEFNGKSNELDYGYKRAKIAWYQVDNLFYRDDRRKPSSISEEELTNHYVRQVTPQEIFPNLDANVINIQPIFDIAYYPAERGPYNLNPTVAATDGIFTSVAERRSNWGGITNSIRTEVDFDKANVEYIEFWLMDPFINTPNGVIKDGLGNSKPNETGGDLFFNLGSISEDFIPDSKHAFENGLPANDFDLENPTGVDRQDPWGFITTQQFLTNAFDNSETARANQDVGLDGISSSEEKTYGPFQQFANFSDPAADDFKYFLGGEHDTKDAGILERYKNFNGLENNSPVSDNTSLYTPAANNIPDNEDLNSDNTLNELEEYYEYKVPLRPGSLEDHKYVVDKVTENVTGENVTWYLFRIPIRQPDNTYGGISGFKSIKYLRTYLTNFSEPVVLRMANFRFVASRWRRYSQSLQDAEFNEPPEPEEFTNLTVSVVNIEENGAGSETASPYVLPPGFDRDRDNTSSVERRLNEQSLQVCVEDLEDANARAVTKQVSLDLINYGRIKMFLHADSEEAQDGEVTAFLRFGSDIDSNYYEVEVPLKITSQGAIMAEDIWPSENEINLDVDELYALKSERDRQNISKRELFPLNGHKQVGNNRIRLRGNPDMSAITWLTIGIRNPRSDNAPKSVCIWANELRVTDFDRTKGWATNAVLNTKLADFANITATARHSTFGFGGIQSKIAERTREETTSYDISANITVDKLLPESLGVKIPMYVSYEKTTIKPKFDPANPDIGLEASLLSLESDQERAAYRQITTDESTRKSLNFTNVRKVKVNPEAKKRIYDIENLSFSYAYSEMLRTNFNLQELYQQNYNAAVAYNYSPQIEPWEPFKNVKFLNSPFLKLIKDFNLTLLPTNLSVRADLRREFRKTVYRNNLEIFNNDLANYEKYFTLNRVYNLQWDLTKNLSLDYSARANAIIDEPEGDIDTDIKRDSIVSNLKNLGRIKNYDQTISANYRLPLDKLPLTDWISADLRYQTRYAWTAGPVNREAELDFGNVIQNSRDNTLSGKIDMVRLYNKIPFLKNINSPPRSSRRSSLTQKTTKQDSVKTEPDNKGLKGFAKLLMSIKSINGTYTLREGTLLPGFTPRAFLFGQDSSFNAPGLPFILGSQNPSIRRSLAAEGLITTNNELTAPFTQTETRDYNIRANVEPVTDLKIQLNLNKTTNSAFEEIYRNVADDGDIPVFESLNPSRSGGYAISFLTIKTAFAKDDKDHNSPVFQDFEKNRLDIMERFNNETGITYDSNAQDVLIPAFIAAYSGNNTSKVSLSPFPSTPLPNWRLDYSGLGRIPALKEVFQSVSITHGYKSSYTITNFTNALAYSQGMELNSNVEDYNVSRFGERNDEGELVPIYIISQAMISEQFSPLVGINIRTKKRLTAKIEYNIKRDVALNISNAQVTEMRSNDVVLELGFTKANFKLPFKSQGRVISLKNDLTFRLSFTLRDTETVQRKIDEVNTVTNGSINLQLRPNISYVLNEKLNLQFYFERNINEPKISSSFRRATTRMGIQIRFSLAQ